MTVRLAPPGTVLTIAHRGASEAAPENTLAAVRQGVASGADLVEVDVQRTSDGALVVHHDVTLGRTTDAERVLRHGASRRVGDCTLAEIRRLDAGSWKHPRYAGEPVPTLAEVLATLQPTGAGLLLELKKPELHPGIALDVADELARFPALVGEQRVVVQSFDSSVLRQLRLLLPDLPLGLLGTPSPTELEGLVGVVEQVNPSHLTVDRGYVARLHDLGFDCHVWTVNRTGALRRALGLGVDGIITNRPAALRAVLAAAGPGARRQAPRASRTGPSRALAVRR